MTNDYHVIDVNMNEEFPVCHLQCEQARVCRGGQEFNGEKELLEFRVPDSGGLFHAVNCLVELEAVARWSIQPWRWAQVDGFVEDAIEKIVFGVHLVNVIASE